MSTVHAKNGALYLGLTTAVPIAEATKWALTIDADKVDDSAFGDAWETRLRSVLSWSGSAEGNFDTASSDLFDIAAATGLCKAYLYPDRADAAKYYYGTCWPNLTIDAIRTDAGRVSVDWEGSGALAYKKTYAGLVLAADPVLYWQLNEEVGASVAVDTAGGDHNGAVSGGAFGAEGVVVGGGTSWAPGSMFSRVRTAAPPHGGKWTVELWRKPASTNGGTHKLAQLTSGGVTTVGYLLSQNSTSLLIYTRTLGASFEVTQFFAAGELAHIVVCFDGVAQTLTIYKNGVFVNSGAPSGGQIFADGDSFLIGDWSGGDGLGDGTIGHVAVYGNRILSAAEVLAHYNAGIGA